MQTTDEVLCPKCGGRTWDNRETKRNPKMPDYKCRDKACDGVIWPPRVPAKSSIPSAHKTNPYDNGKRLPNEEDEAFVASLVADAPPQAGNKSTQLYLAAMKFVVNTVVPVWEAGQITYTASDVNAATATIMIDHQRRTGR